MICVVCQASFATGVCPSCGYDHAHADARDPNKILGARHSFQEKVTQYAPESRVTWKDKLPLWIGLVVGVLFFLFFLKACSLFA